jgi:hypothetical protein
VLLSRGNAIGTTGNQSVRAVLLCGNLTRQSGLVPFESNGDFRIDDVRTPSPPIPCDSPVLLIVNPANRWFAADIPLEYSASPGFRRPCGGNCRRRCFQGMHLDTEDHAARFAGLDRAHPDHTPRQHRPLLIANLDEHRVFPGGFIPGMSDDVFHAQRSENTRSRGRCGEGIGMKASLERRTDRRTPQDLLPAAWTLPRLASDHGRPLPEGRVATVLG